MDKSLSEKLIKALNKIDRPGSFCVRGSVPGVGGEEAEADRLALTVKQASGESHAYQPREMRSSLAGFLLLLS